MSLASIERITAITALNDFYSTVTVCNFTVVVKETKFKVGDLVIYVKPDTMFNKSRVRAVKICNVWSEGYIFSLDKLPEGSDVTELLGVTKHVTQPDQARASQGLLYGIPLTNEENWQRCQIVEGTPVDITLKVDGMSMTAGCHPEKGFYMLSRRGKVNPADKLSKPYLEVCKRYSVEEKLTAYCKENNIHIALRGEVFGAKIANHSWNPHTGGRVDITFFSTYLPEEHRYARKDEASYYLNLCKELDLPHVKTIEEDVPLTQELIAKYREGLETIDSQPFEGVVIKYKDGKSFKVINMHYDSKK